MHIPYVIDNIEYRLADVLNALLQRERGQQIDVATAYFSIRGFEQIRRTLPEVRRFASSSVGRLRWSAFSRVGS
jgi:ubiquinone/menaquinone biosynthesis C-methylase UbiE